MKTIFSVGIKVFVTVIIALAITTTSTSQFSINGPGTNGSGINANGTPNNLPTVPLDGGMSVMLLISGIGYGAKKLKHRRDT